MDLTVSTHDQNIDPNRFNLLNLCVRTFKETSTIDQNTINRIIQI